MQAQFFGPDEVPPTNVEHRADEPAPAGDPARLPRLDSIEAVVVHSSAAPVGRFDRSNALLNRIRDLVRWAQRSNMVSVLTDCPHREKLGWIEQFHLNGPAIRYEFDVARLFTKAMRDMADAQTDDGLVPNIAPEYTEFQGALPHTPPSGAPPSSWCPWQQYLFDGDVDLLRTHYDAMKRYVAFLDQRAATDCSLTASATGTTSISPKPGRAGLTPASSPPRRSITRRATLAQIARAAGEVDDAPGSPPRRPASASATTASSSMPTRPTYATGSQCANALPLAMGLSTRRPASRPLLDALVRTWRSAVTRRPATSGSAILLQALATTAAPT